MESIESMLKELGTVTIRHAAGMYQADSGCVLARGESAPAPTVEGAVRNALDLKRLHEAGPPAIYRFRGIGADGSKGEWSSIEAAFIGNYPQLFNPNYYEVLPPDAGNQRPAGEIPTAGQD